MQQSCSNTGLELWYWSKGARENPPTPQQTTASISQPGCTPGRARYSSSANVVVLRYGPGATTAWTALHFVMKPAITGLCLLLLAEDVVPSPTSPPPR